jgi:hypothetical protein
LQRETGTAATIFPERIAIQRIKSKKSNADGSTLNDFVAPTSTKSVNSGVFKDTLRNAETLSGLVFWRNRQHLL